jgi:hypothetical protein
LHTLPFDKGGEGLQRHYHAMRLGGKIAQLDFKLVRFSFLSGGSQSRIVAWASPVINC